MNLLRLTKHGARPYLAIILLCLASLGPAWAQSISALVPAARIPALLAGDYPTRVDSGRNPALELLPAHPSSVGIRDRLAAEGPNLVVEALFFLPYPAGGPAPDREASKLLIYNILRSVGSMEGIEYYSASRETMRLFYERSSLVSGPDGALAVHDEWKTRYPASETVYARQKDLSFGDNLYRMDFSIFADGLLHSVTNLTAMKYGLLTIARPEAVRTRSLILPVNEGWVFYVVTSTNTVMLPGLRSKLESSFGNRARAVFDWFRAQAVLHWAEALSDVRAVPGAFELDLFG